MSTKPINDNKYPQHFFVVYGNQKFHHFYNPKGISPLELFSKINSNTISTQNACYRVTRQGNDHSERKTAEKAIFWLCF